MVCQYYEFWYDYIKPKYQLSCTQWSCTQDSAKLCYMDTGRFVIYIKNEDFYEDIANDVKKWFDTSHYDDDDKRPLPVDCNKKEIGFLKMN